jgi:plastocyanin
VQCDHDTFRGQEASMRLTTFMTLATAVLVAAACGDDPAGPAANEIWAKNSQFQPDDRTINLGATVTWVNEDGLTHNITANTVPTGAAGFTQNITANGGTFVLTPAIAGTYTYFCNIHGTATTGMRASLNVVVP